MVAGPPSANSRQGAFGTRDAIFLVCSIGKGLFEDANTTTNNQVALQKAKPILVRRLYQNPE
jgi:hypothetical protein